MDPGEDTQPHDDADTPQHPLPPLRPGGGGGAGMEPARRRERPGRNEPCWCDSGKKYKRCHADEDDRGERAQLDEANARAVEDDLAQMLLAIGEEELAIFEVGEEEARENMARLVALAWNVDSYEQRRDHDSAETLRAELDGDADEEELHALVEELIERKQELCPGDQRIVAQVSIVDGALVVRGA
ncbi:MAG TPA: SEC-C domain-containing protein [Nannocystaceae bacterium]|nr:SEC-C domain-containing protein [Nannocystaceae bacterium]